jgi:hypothetical protein
MKDKLLSPLEIILLQPISSSYFQNKWMENTMGKKL